MKKAIVIICILVLMINIFPITKTYALDFDKYKVTVDPIGGDDAKPFREKLGIILGLLRNVSVIIAVIAVTIIGIKYITGSLEEKANYRKTLMPIAVGIIIIALSVTIVVNIYNAMQ